MCQSDIKRRLAIKAVLLRVYQNIGIICQRPKPTKNETKMKSLFFDKASLLPEINKLYKVALGFYQVFISKLDTFFSCFFTKYVCVVNIPSGLYKYNQQSLIFIILSIIVRNGKSRNIKRMFTRASAYILCRITLYIIRILFSAKIDHPSKYTHI